MRGNSTKTHRAEPLTPVFRLVQITDSHNFSDTDAHIRGVNPHDSLLEVINLAQPFIQPADAIMLTGDLAHDEHEQTYKHVRQMMLNQAEAIWSLPGNHDNPMEMCHILSGDEFAYLGHHRAANWEIVALDSHCPHQASGLLGEAELQRLDSRLKDSDAEYFLIALHHHVLPVQSTWLDSVSLKDAEDMLQIITQDERVKVVTCGHVHQCFERKHENIEFIACPSTGTQFTPLQSEFSLDSRPPGFRWINLYADGTLQTQVVWLNTAPWN